MAKRQKKESEQMEGSWLASYGDMITLILCFFILLYSMAQIDLAKFKKMSESMNASFGAATPDTKKGPANKGYEKGSAGASENQIEDVKKKVDTKIAEAGLSGTVKTTLDDEGLLIRMSTDQILFDTGSAALKPAAASFLATLADIVGPEANQVIVEGHTDNIPIQAGFTYPTNWELSAARASAVIRYFIEARGMSPARMRASGYADTRPRMPNDTLEHQYQNRRVEVLIKPLVVEKPAATTKEPAKSTGGTDKKKSTASDSKTEKKSTSDKKTGK